LISGRAARRNHQFMQQDAAAAAYAADAGDGIDE
jgi:hypothetical protein